MNEYTVIIETTAEEDIESISCWIAENSPQKAREWYAQVKEAILSLSQHPNRCPLALENKFFEEEIRHLLYGKHRYIYRILFTVQKDTVHVLHVRHGAREPLRRKINESNPYNHSSDQ